MPAGTGYGNDRHLKKAIKRGRFSPASTSQKERKRLADRHRIDKEMARARPARPKAPTPPPPSSIDNLIGWLTGNNPLTEALRPKGKKGQR